MLDRPLTLDELRAALRYIAADSRDTWVLVGMGVKDAFGEAGRDAWDDWSQTGSGYKPSDAATVWRSFRKSGTGLGSVIKLALDNGWTPDKTELTAADKRRLTAEAEARRVARQAEVEADEAKLAIMREAVAAACLLIWNKHCKPAGTSAYLARKGVAGFGIGFFDYTVVLSIDDKLQRCDVWVGSEVRGFFNNLPKPRPDSHSFLMFKHGSIAIPLRDAAGKLWSLQAINDQGTKLFPKYGRKSGCFHLIGGEAEADAKALFVAEGYATAASVWTAMQEPTVVAIDSGNLLPVARAMRERMPTVRLVIAGDDDPTKPNNPGRTKAEAAALAVGGVAVFPVMPAEVAA